MYSTLDAKAARLETSLCGSDAVSDLLHCDADLTHILQSSTEKKAMPLNCPLYTRNNLSARLKELFYHRRILNLNGKQNQRARPVRRLERRDSRMRVV